LPTVTTHFFRKLKPSEKRYKQRTDNLETRVEPNGRIVLTVVHKQDGKDIRHQIHSAKGIPSKERIAEINTAYLERVRLIEDGVDLERLGREQEEDRLQDIYHPDADLDFGTPRVQETLVHAARHYWIQFNREKASGTTESHYLKLILEGYDGKSGVGDMIPRAIKRHHLQRVLDGIKEAGKHRTANHVKKCMSRFWLWMSRRGVVDSREPARDLDAKAPKPRDRLFTPDEMQEILCGDAHPLVWFTAYTALRRAEIVKLQWEDMDEDGFITVIVKGGKKHIHYLTPQARGCSQTTEGYLFTGRHSSGPMLGNSLSEIMRNRYRDVGVQDATGHDWRSAFYCWGEQAGIADRILHACLSHSKQDLTGVYGLHSFKQEKRETLQSWADYLDGLCR